MFGLIGDNTILCLYSLSLSFPVSPLSGSNVKVQFSNHKSVSNREVTSYILPILSLIGSLFCFFVLNLFGTHIHTHTYMHTYIYAHTHIYRHTHIRKHTYIHTYRHTHTHTYTHIHTQTHKNTHTHIHTQTHTHTHTHTAIHS